MASSAPDHLRTPGLISNRPCYEGINFGSTPFDGEARHLDISVRCPAGSGVFSRLPRQPITPIPYSIFACSAHSVPWGGITDVPSSVTDFHSLDAPDGDPVNALLVGNEGNVNVDNSIGVGGAIFAGFDQASSSVVKKTFSTAHSPDNVPSDIKFGIADGFDVAGMHVKNVRDENGTHNSQSIEFVTHHGSIDGGTRMAIDKRGNVGIGTDTPAVTLDVRGDIKAATLDAQGGNISAASLDATGGITAGSLEVQGDIKLGPSGDLFAVGGSFDNYILTGFVNTDGRSGRVSNAYTSRRISQSVYEVTYSPSFRGNSAVSIQPIGVAIPSLQFFDHTGFRVQMTDAGGFPIDASFSFLVVGLR